MRNSPWIGATLARAIAGQGGFDLDYFCSHVSDQLRCIRCRDHVAILDDPEACKSASRHKSSFCSPLGKPYILRATLVMQEDGVKLVQPMESNVASSSVV